MIEDPPKTLFDLWPVGQAIIQWTVLVLGWIVVSKGNDKRERRKEIRSLLNDIRGKTLTVESQAVEYYRQAPDKSADLGINVKREMQHLARLAALLTRLNAKLDFADAVMVFRQRVTGGDFESSERKPRTPDDPLFQDIAAAAFDLTDEMERLFSATYS